MPDYHDRPRRSSWLGLAISVAGMVAIVALLVLAAVDIWIFEDDQRVAAAIESAARPLR